MSAAKKRDEEVIKIPVRRKSTSFADPLKYRIETDEEVNFTKDLAYQFLELDTFMGERSVREKHVQFLYDEWAAGRFLWQNVILASAKVSATGKVFRVNGQHTSWMRINIPPNAEPIKAPIRRMNYIVDDDEGLRGLYAAFDRNAVRSVGHVSKVLLMDTDAAREVPSSYLGKLVAGFKVYWSEHADARVNMSAAELTGLIEKNYAQLFNIVGRYFTIHYSDSMELRRAGLIAAMFCTFEKNVQASDEFWTPVLTAIGLDKKTDPRWQLRRFLETTTHTRGSGANKNFISQEEMMCTALLAWNHWRDGHELQVLKTISERPKVKS